MKDTEEKEGKVARGAHAESDIAARPIVKFGIGLAVAIMISAALMWGLFKFFAQRSAHLDPPPRPLAPTGAQRLPPEPRLQGAPGHAIHPLEEMKQMRAAADETLNSYGWVDRNAGVVRIPIEQAMRLTAERGLPVRAPAQGSAIDDGKIYAPADSSSGRTLERRQP